MVMSPLGMMEMPDPLNSFYHKIDTALPTSFALYLPGTIGVFKTLNLKTNLYDISMTFKIALSGEILKLSTDTMHLDDELLFSSPEFVEEMLVKQFLDLIPYAAVKGAFEYWHTTYTGPKTLWEFMQMGEPAFDAMMLKGKLPNRWNSVFVALNVAGKTTSSTGDTLFNGINITTSTTISPDTIEVVSDDGTKTIISLGD